MVSQALKIGVVILLANAALPAATAASQAEDLAAGMTTTTDGADLATGRTENFAAPEAAGPLSDNKSGIAKPPVPEIGISAMLITGVLMIGIAVRKRTVAA